jgi:hypothetical protein
MQASYILYLFLLINIDFSFIFTWFLVFRVLWREYLKSLLTKLKQGRTQEGQYTRITTNNIIKVELDKFSWVGWGAVATAASLLPAVCGTGQKFLLAWLQHCFGSFSQPKTYLFYEIRLHFIRFRAVYIYIFSLSSNICCLLSIHLVNVRRLFHCEERHWFESVTCRLRDRSLIRRGRWVRKRGKNM